jgi:hypothetical protein
MAAHEALVSEVAHAATEFHSAMPKQSELERATAAKFQNLLQQAAAEGIDMQCLMATLVGQFDDEDVAWDPDHLLMQLTSEINDRMGGAEDEESDAHVIAGQFGVDVSVSNSSPSGNYNSPSQSQANFPTDSNTAGGGRNRGSALENNNNNNTSSIADTVTSNTQSQQQQQQAAENAPAHGRRRK